MNATIEKIDDNDVVISNNSEIEPKKEVEKNSPQNNQFCLKMFDYFIF